MLNICKVKEKLRLSFAHFGFLIEVKILIQYRALLLVYYERYLQSMRVYWARNPVLLTEMSEQNWTVSASPTPPMMSEGILLPHRLWKQQKLARTFELLFLWNIQRTLESDFCVIQHQWIECILFFIRVLWHRVTKVLKRPVILNNNMNYVMNWKWILTQRFLFHIGHSP